MHGFRHSLVTNVYVCGFTVYSLQFTVYSLYCLSHSSKMDYICKHTLGITESSISECESQTLYP